MKKLNNLIKSCKAGIHLTINAHKDYYESVDDNIDDDFKKELELNVLNRMKELDTIIELQFYPDTPVGFYRIYHYDLELAIDEALNILKCRDTPEGN